jgi:mono/diheme cytochrome c family protein
MNIQHPRRARLSAAFAACVLAASLPGHAADGSPEQFAEGKKLFMQGATPACALCHTLKDAGSEGAIGPILDELKPDAARVANALRNGLGNMPPYKATLSEAQILALAHYVAKASGAIP